MTAEELVKQKYPDASCWRFGTWRDGEPFYRVYAESHVTEGGAVLGRGSEEPESAWADAASRLQSEREDEGGK